MTAIIYHYLLFITFLFLATEKFKIQEKLMVSKWKIFFLLGFCDFCFNFWVALIAVLYVDLITWQVDNIDLILPFVVVGLHIIMQKIFYNE